MLPYIFEQVVRHLLDSNRTKVINDGRTAASLFFNRSFDSIVEPVFVGPLGERRMNMVIGSVDENGSKEVGIE